MYQEHDVHSSRITNLTEKRKELKVLQKRMTFHPQKKVMI